MAFREIATLLLGQHAWRPGRRVGRAALGALLLGSMGCAETARTRAPSAPALGAPGLRLPRFARPTSYDLELDVAPEREAFRGVITLHLAVEVPTNVLWLNAKGLAVEAASLRQDGREGPARLVTGNEDFVGFSFEELVPRGPASLRIAFAGKLDPRHPRGMYRHAEAGRWYAYTMFEPTDARRAFPCFDEPEYKVPWRIHLRVPEADEALSNARASSVRSLGDGTKLVSFQETPPLPPYLVAVAVGPFDIVDVGQVGRRHVPFRIAVQRGRAAELSYARTSLPRMVDLLEEFVGSPYPYGHLDVLVTPGRWGTVEYPGLLALGQALMLMRPEEETLPRKRELANIAIHELAHHWFGDAVTIGWWSDAWTKESTAKWIDFKVTERFEPSWRYGEGFVRNAARALEADALPSVGPVHRPIHGPGDILAAYDGPITYAKGAAILEMVAAWVGENHVREGLRDFVTRHGGGVATSRDYLDALALGKPEVGDVVASFVDQPGVPVVAATVQCVPGARARLQLSQRPYASLPTPVPVPHRRWAIPICFRYDDRGHTRSSCTLVREDHAMVELPTTGCPRLLSVNDQGNGYYVSDYDDAWWRETAGASPTSLTPAEQRRVLVDAGMLVDAGALSLGRLLPIVARWVKAPAAAPAVVEASLDLLRRVPEPQLESVVRVGYERFLLDTYGAWARRLGLQGSPNEAPTLASLRPRLLRLLAARDPELLRAARGVARAWVEGAGEASTDAVMGEAALAAVVSSGERTAFEAALREAERTADPRRQAALLRALGYTQDPELLKLALPWLTKDRGVAGDAFAMLTRALETPETTAAAYGFLTEHFDELAARFTDQRIFVLLAAVERLCDRERREAAAVSLRRRLCGRTGALEALERSLERARRCEAVRERNRESLAAPLRAVADGLPLAAPAR